MPALASARLDGLDGARGRSTAGRSRVHAGGRRPGRAARGRCAVRPSSSTSSRAAAPSLSGEALPAVTVPSSVRNDGLEPGHRLRRACRRGCTRRADAGRPARGTGTDRRRRRTAVAAQAAAALSVAGERELVLLLAADRRACRRSVRRASPSGIGPLRGHPRVDHAPAQGGGVQLRWPAGKARSGLGSTQGARLIDSTPPATTTSASPTAIARAAWMTASRPEPQSRLTVTPGTRDGQPGQQRGHAPDVAVLLAGAVGVAEVDVVDPGGVQLGRAGQQEFTDGVGGQVVGAHRGQGAVVIADGVRTASTM